MTRYDAVMPIGVPYVRECYRCRGGVDAISTCTACSGTGRGAGRRLCTACRATDIRCDDCPTCNGTGLAPSSRRQVDLGVDSATGRRVRVSLKTSNARTARVRASRDLSASQGFAARPRLTVGAMWDGLLASAHARGRRPLTLEGIRRARLHVERHFGADMAVADLAVTDIDEYVAARRRVVSDATVNNELSRLRAALRYAVEAGQLDRAPNLPHLDTERLEAPFLSRQQVANVLAVADDDVAFLVVLGTHTGLREGEMVMLRWSDVELDAGRLRVQGHDGWRPKTRTSQRRVELSATVRRALLERRPRTLTSGYVLGDDLRLLETDRPRIPLRVGRRFRQTLKQAGIDIRRNTRWHLLRHTFASWLLMDGVPVDTVRRLLGHANLQAMACYSHLTEEHCAAAVAALDGDLPEPRAGALLRHKSVTNATGRSRKVPV